MRFGLLLLGMLAGQGMRIHALKRAIDRFTFSWLNLELLTSGITKGGFQTQ